MSLEPPRKIVCPKCGKESWTPYRAKVKNFYGTTYAYLVYRHPDGRRRTPRKCTVRILEAKGGQTSECVDTMESTEVEVVVNLGRMNE